MNNGQNNQFQRNSQYNNSSNNYPYGGNPNVPSQNRMINNNSYGTYQNSIPQNQAQQNPVNYNNPTNSQYTTSQTQIPTQSQPQVVPANYQYGSNLTNSGYKIPGQKNPNKKKKLIILLGVVILVVIVVVAVFFLKKDNKKKKDSNSNGSSAEMSYEEVMQEYGSSMEKQIATYRDENGVLPNKDTILKNTEVEDYTVECEKVEIHSDGKVFLDKCSIDDSEAIYSYGRATDESAIMKDYGNKALAYVSDYYKINNGLPVAIDMEYPEKVECNVVKVYNEKTIYLNDCSINDSEDKYSFGYLKEDGYVYISYTGHNYEVLGETTTEEHESNKVQKKQVKCATKNCTLDKYLGPYIAVKEADGRYILHSIQSSSSLFTVANNLEYTFISKEHKEVYGILLRNSKGEEAIYSLSENEMKKEYGKYLYVWDGNSNSDNLWDKYPSVETKNSLVPARKTKDGKYGLISLNSDGEVLPFEYDTMSLSGEYISVKKEGKKGLISADGKKILLGEKFYEDLVFANYQDKYALVYENDELQVINLDGNLIKKVAEIPRGYVLMNEEGQMGMQYQEENGKAIFYVLFRTDKEGNPCAKYTYNFTNNDLNIDENKCEEFQG